MRIVASPLECCAIHSMLCGITNIRGVCDVAPCRLRGCKNRPAPFPGRMSYKATKPGLVLFYILACFIVLVFIRAPFIYC